MLHNRPPEIRKKIALIITLSIAVILIAVMVILYRSPSYRKTGEPSGAIRDFYKAIQHSGESLFQQK